jgi:hypothetical protein
MIMTDQELQQAIDKAREFMNIAANTGGLLHRSKEHTQTMLRELEAIQVVRAGMATQPTLAQVEA